VVRVSNQQVLHELPAVLELLAQTARDVTAARSPAGGGGGGTPRQGEAQEDPAVMASTSRSQGGEGGGS
jgi:hypothetical protein